MFVLRVASYECPRGLLLHVPGAYIEYGVVVVSGNPGPESLFCSSVNLLYYIV